MHLQEKSKAERLTFLEGEVAGKVTSVEFFLFRQIASLVIVVMMVAEMGEGLDTFAIDKLVRRWLA